MGGSIWIVGVIYNSNVDWNHIHTLPTPSAGRCTIQETPGGSETLHDSGDFFG